MTLTDTKKIFIDDVYPKMNAFIYTRIKCHVISEQRKRLFTHTKCLPRYGCLSSKDFPEPK